MKKSRSSDSQVLSILKQAENDIAVPALCRKHGMSSATFYKWRAKYGGMDASAWRSILVWHKPTPRPMPGAFRRDAEHVVHAVKAPSTAWSRRRLPGVFNHRAVAADKVHLTGKPLPLLVDLLGIAPPEGGTVLDPFTGGGTTPLACIETGRRFIGVKLPGDSFDLAGERIKRVGESRPTGERPGRNSPSKRNSGLSSGLSGAITR
jgi:hypothetical protein